MMGSLRPARIGPVGDSLPVAPAKAGAYPRARLDAAGASTRTTYLGPCLRRGDGIGGHRLAVFSASACRNARKRFTRNRGETVWSLAQRGLGRAERNSTGKCL